MNLSKVILIFVWFFSFGYCWDPDYIINFLLPLCKLAQMQELLWFPPINLSLTNSEKVEKIINTLHEGLGITQMVLNNRSDIRLLKMGVKKMYVCMVFMKSLSDPIMYVHDRVLIGRHNSVSLFVVMDEVDDFNTVRTYVQYMKRKSFYNSLLYIKNTNGTNGLWGYTEFPRFVIENRTDIWGWLMSNIAKIQAASLDTEGYEFYSPLRLDVPYVFPYVNSREELQYHGTSYKMIELFIEFVNASLVEYKMPPDSLGGNVINMKDALDLVREDKCAFLAHAYALFAIDDEIDKSYPIMVVKWCLMVPIWNSVSTYYYPVQPFDTPVWYAFLGTFLALAVTDLALITWQFSKQTKGIRKSKKKLLEAFCDSLLNDFCFVHNISTGKTLRTPTTVIRAFVLLTVFFYGFFITANYTSVLGSILTVTLFREDVNTMEDLIRINISVMIIDYELEFLLAGGNDLSPEFSKLLLPVDVATFNKHQLALNSSFAYFITDDKWHFIRLQQTYLKQGIFKFTDICFGSHHLAYAMRPDSSIWRNLEYYIFRMHSSGMLQHYERTSFDFAVHAGLMTRLTEANEYTSAGMQHLFVVFMLLLLVFAMSFFVFLGEYFLYRCQRKKTNVRKH